MNLMIEFLNFIESVVWVAATEMATATMHTIVDVAASEMPDAKNMVSTTRTVVVVVASANNSIS